MKLHFPWPEVAKILDEVRAATVVKPLYGKVTGKGLWLVGDEGVYLMPNTAGATRTIAYAKECDPKMVDDWWDVKRATFGGDDGVEFISIEEIERISAGAPGAQPETLRANFTPKRMTINIQWKRASKKGGAAWQINKTLIPSAQSIAINKGFLKGRLVAIILVTGQPSDEPL